MKLMNEKAVLIVLAAAVAMNLVAILSKTGAAQTATQEMPGTFQISCGGTPSNQCLIINTRSGKVARSVSVFAAVDH